MYQPSYSSSSSSYSSPPPPSDPYRASPIPVAPRQPYNLAFSPPPIPPSTSGYMPMPPGQSQRYQQYAPSSHSSGHSMPSGSRYNPGAGGGPYMNGGNPQQAGPGPGHVPPQTHSQRHKGTLAPGQIVKVGEQAVKVERYLSEGGYAHVYLTSSEQPIYPPAKADKKGRWGEKGYTEHCLKRIAFQDDSVWIDVKKEIEVMKALPPTPHLVQYLGSTHTRTSKGGHEVFILMEFCAGGGIIDLLNKRLRDRLKEIEILNIFTDVCEAVAAMHALKQPLLHRDLKIENVLSHPSATPPSPQRPMSLTFKLCDFGSTTFPASHPPANKVEADALAIDLNRHTTLQYRSPEMVEPLLGFPVSLPSDVWALGVLLYKLCYYTTPFEEHGTLAIVNAKYTFPQYPVYSPRLQHLIASMLLEQPMRRPTVFEVLKIAHEMSGTKPEIDYPDSMSRSFQQQIKPSTANQSQASSSSTNLLDFTSPTATNSSTPVMTPSLVSTVQPGRRGRPTREGSHLGSAALPAMPKPPAVGYPSRNQPGPQVTGENPAVKVSSPPPDDAFGMPAVSAGPRAGETSSASRAQASLQPTQQGSSGPSTSSSVAMDAFGMPTTAKSPPPGGFGDSFGSKPFQPTSRFGQSLSQGKSGFGDSFSSSPKSPPSKMAKPTTKTSVPTAPAPDVVEESKPVKTSTASADGDYNFETRFPSIETLSNGPLSPTENLISPITSPPISRPRMDTKPSLMGNLTGGTLSSPHMAVPSVNGGPQPRSTNVTGTAFKQEPATSTSNTKADNLQPSSESVDTRSSTKATTSALDLMTGDDPDLLQAPSLQPIPSGSSAASLVSAGSQGQSGAEAPPSTDHSQPLLAQTDSSQPNTNSGSAQRSSTEIQSPQSVPHNAAQLDSSDEEGPEPVTTVRRASPTFMPPSRMTASPSMANRMAAFQTAQAENKASSSRGASSNRPLKSATSPLPTDTTVRPNPSREASDRSRPRSMYAFPSSSSTPGATSSRTVVQDSPPKQAEALAPPNRPGHTRKGSINDMVSKFENLKSTSPAIPAATTTTTSSTSTSRPSVAIKPAGLRKPSLDSRASPITPSAATSPSQTTSSSPVKAKMTSTSTSAALPPKPDKPIMMRQQSTKHAEAPRPEGFSRSSSGRAFPITKTRPAANETPVSGSGGDSEQIGGDRGDRSPEKQQPVNALIARWNKGEVGGKPVVRGKPVA